MYRLGPLILQTNKHTIMTQHTIFGFSEQEVKDELKMLKTNKPTNHVLLGMYSASNFRGRYKDWLKYLLEEFQTKKHTNENSIY